jgi:hypothetical protein
MIQLFAFGFSFPVAGQWWNESTKAVNPASSYAPFSRSTSDIVDAYNVGNTLRKVFHNGTGGVNYVDIPNTILLKFQYQAGTPLNVDLYTYSLTTRTVTHAVNTNSSFIPSSFSRNTSDIIDAYYTGAILTKVYHDGAGGITTVDTDTTIHDIVNAYNVGTTMRIAYIDQFAVTTYVDTANTIVLWFKTDAGNSLLMNLYTYSLTSRTVSYTQFTNQVARSANFSKPIIELVDSYCAGTTLNEVYHNNAGGVNVVVTVNSATCGYVVSTPDIVVTETIKVKIDDECKDNPVYLKWRNTLGGWDQWLFHTSQQLNVRTESLGEYKINFTDLETAETDVESRGFDSGSSIMG